MVVVVVAYDDAVDGTRSFCEWTRIYHCVLLHSMVGIGQIRNISQPVSFQHALILRVAST